MSASNLENSEISTIELDSEIREKGKIKRLNKIKWSNLDLIFPEKSPIVMIIFRANSNWIERTEIPGSIRKRTKYLFSYYSIIVLRSTVFFSLENTRKYFWGSIPDLEKIKFTIQLINKDIV